MKNFWETTKHKLWVLWYIFSTCCVLMKRAFLHDLSKYGKHEEPYFRKYVHRLKDVEYGTGHYQSLLSAIKPALEHHYENNSHHPEYHENGFDDMSLLDQIELLCDWKAATRRHKNGSLKNSIEFNSKRFGYSEKTKKALLKTAKEIGLF